MMKIKLTDSQAIQLATNAVNASAPMGLGFLHHQEREYTPEDVRGCIDERGIDIDYFDGRMVKLYIHKNDGEYEFPDHDPRPDYQSWCGTYPSYKDLINSVVDADSK